MAHEGGPFNDAARYITEGAHWRVLIHPQQYNPERLQSGFRNLRKVVENTQVSLRGWPFPMLAPSDERWKDDVRVVEGCLWGKAHFEEKAEVWKLCPSGLFAGAFRLRELNTDYDAKIRRNTGWRELPEDGAPPGVVDFGNQVWSITEFFEFAARLARECRFEEGVAIQAALRNVESFGMGTADFNRFLTPFYVCRDPEILLQKDCSYTEIVSHPHMLALEAVREFLGYFDLDVRADVIQALQKKLYSLRIGGDRVDVSTLRWDEEAGSEHDAD